MPLSDILDTAGYMTRDPKLFQTFGKNWYAGSFKSFPKFPKKMMLSTSFEHVSPAATAIYNDFFDKLSNFLGATVQANFSIPNAWNATSGTGIPINTFLNETYPTLIAFHQWTVLGSKLFADFAAQNDGRNPHINPAVLERWHFGQSQGPTAFAEEVSHQQTFENWTANNFLLADNQSCSDSLYLYPQNAGQYNSRETYFLGPSSPPFGFGDSRVAVFGRSPDIVIPLGQIPFNSTISNKTEMVPVTVDVVARRGCDFVLLDLVGALADKGIITSVKTGRTAF